MLPPVIETLSELRRNGEGLQLSAIGAKSYAAAGLLKRRNVVFINVANGRTAVAEFVFENNGGRRSLRGRCKSSCLIRTLEY